MNFLLHRHFARCETGSDAVAFGAMLPDLVRLVDRRFRHRRRDEEREEREAPASPVARALREGIAHHLEADAWFHQTAVFHAGEKRTAATLRATGDAAPRIGLFGHVTFEMCLDGAWLRRTGDPDGALAALRSDITRFAAASSEALREATSETSAPDVIDDRIAVLWSRLPDLAAGYATGDGVARRLDGVRRSLGMPAASDAVRATWARALEGVLDDAARSLDDLVTDREAALAAQPSAPSP